VAAVGSRRGPSYYCYARLQIRQQDDKFQISNLFDTSVRLPFVSSFCPKEFRVKIKVPTYVNGSSHTLTKLVKK
jgi:hypothetical protein